MTNPVSAYSPQLSQSSPGRTELPNIRLSVPTLPKRKCHKLKLTDPQRVNSAAIQSLSAVRTNTERLQQPTGGNTPPPVACKPSEENIRKAKERFEKSLGSPRPQTPTSPGSDTSDRSGCLGSGEPDCPCPMCEFDRWFE